MTTTSANPIFAPLDAANLTTQGLLGPIQGTGSRRCHKRRLNRSSEEEYQSIPLDISHDSPAAEDAFAMIPDAMISRDTLIYLGLSESKTNEIWGEWTDWPSYGPGREIDADNSGGLQVTFIDFITTRLQTYDDVYEDDDAKWIQCLDKCGVSASVKDAIMDANFKHIRLSDSCIFWVTDTIEMRYAGLREIQRASQEREMELRRAASRPAGRGHHSRGSGSGSIGGEQGESAQRRGHARGSSSSQGQRSVSGMQLERTPGIHSETWNSDMANTLRGKSDHVVLFKGMDLARIPDLFNEDGSLQNIERLLSKPPTDFSGTRSLFYFTRDQHIAEYYAAFAKRRSGCESIVMVVLTIPTQAINDLEEPDILRLYFPSPQWKQLVWRCKANRSIPKPLRKYRNAILVIGTVSKGAERMYQNMESWEDVGEECVLRVGPSRPSNAAEQYVFSGEEDGREFLVEHSKLDAFRFSEEDVEVLLRRYS